MNWILTHLEGTEYLTGKREHGVFTEIHGKIDHQDDGFHWAVFHGRKVITGKEDTFTKATIAAEKEIQTLQL
jgi:hypothetical protein